MAARSAGKKRARSFERHYNKLQLAPQAARRPQRRSPNGAPPKKNPRKVDLDFDAGDRLIGMGPLKLAARVLPVSSAARMLILEEPDELPIGVYCIKIGVWFKLMMNRADK